MRGCFVLIVSVPVEGPEVVEVLVDGEVATVFELVEDVATMGIVT
jgi:hypothetical protein